MVGEREGRLRGGPGRQLHRQARGGIHETGRAQRRLGPIHAVGLPRRQGRVPRRRGRRPGSPQLPNRTGQPILCDVRQDPSARSLQSPRGQGDGQAGLRAVGGLRDPGHAPPDDAGVSRPPGRPVSRSGAEYPRGEVREGSKALVCDAAVRPGPAPGAHREARAPGQRSATGTDMLSRRRNSTADLHHRFGRGLRPHLGCPGRAGADRKRGPLSGEGAVSPCAGFHRAYPRRVRSGARHRGNHTP